MKSTFIGTFTVFYCKMDPDEKKYLGKKNIWGDDVNSRNMTFVKDIVIEFLSEEDLLENANYETVYRKFYAWFSDEEKAETPRELEINRVKYSKRCEDGRQMPIDYELQYRMREAECVGAMSFMDCFGNGF